MKDLLAGKKEQIFGSNLIWLGAKAIQSIMSVPDYPELSVKNVYFALIDYEVVS